MFERIKERFIEILTSRMTVMALVVFFLGGILIYRLFDLQIVRGEEFLNDFILESKKTREVVAARGNIYDRYGELLAYNELAYSVKIEDVYETSRNKNKLLNANILKLIKLIEKNGDNVITDFGIILDENNEFAFSMTDDTKRLRFLADVYGESYIKDLDLEQQTATPDEVIDYLGDRYDVGDYEDPEDSKSDFIVGKGYTKDELLKMITVRYAMGLTSFQKYIGTTVAKDISEETRAVIMENMSELDGVSIEEDPVRRYVDSVYFSQIIGYTGKISSDELETLNAQALEEMNISDRYSINDVVGKTGIEAYMETTLQGTKGIETVYVNNTGKVISIDEDASWEPVAGNDVYLTIDKELQIATYNILEQQIAGVLLAKIRNAKEYTGSSNSSKEMYIPIYDVYFALFDNSVIDLNHMASENAGEYEKLVYEKYEEYKALVYEKLLLELTEKKTPYNKLDKEYQVYESNIVEYLLNRGILDETLIDTQDATYKAWREEETISLSEYLHYAISMGWVDVTKLSLTSQYADSEEIYEKVVDSIFQILDNTADYQKKLFKYMLKNDLINGKHVCFILCEQGQVEIAEEDISRLYDGKLSAYEFMINRIKNLDITPAQLALDPCSGSIVVTEVGTGDVLALVSYPSYDNNRMANSVDAEYFASLQSDKSKPLLNYATQYKSAPGSTFKMVSATAALMEGVATTSSTVTCTGSFNVVTPPPKCWIYPGAHGAQTISNAIKNSCNVFFYQAGYNMSTVDGTYDAEAGLATLAKYADMYGLSEKSGVEIAEYAPDISDELPIPSAIGQGTNNFTTVGLARYTATVAGNGTCYNLTLLDKVTNPDGKVIEEFTPELRNTINMPQEYWNAIHTGMRGVVERMSYFSDLGMNVAGKTGTAQESTTRADHALFVGYAPYENPEIAIATRIAFGYSSSYAAQASKEVIKYYYNLADEEEILTGEANSVDGATYGD
ncbi:MAG: penicillin-binding transpeptidase domain-containing protein [Lachnospiraceae bacterium]|nr:penicillin-binding transpeptidase domain-containing protein [Lachnospiraceae bacterium]